MNPTILIVDDDEAARYSLRMVLETYGYEVKCFATAEDFSQESLDAACCLILDVNLPGASGLELLAQIRADGVLVPAVLMSGNVTAAMHAEAAGLGALAFLEKPVDFDALEAAIGSIDI